MPSAIRFLKTQQPTLPRFVVSKTLTDEEKHFQSQWKNGIFLRATATTLEVTEKKFSKEVKIEHLLLTHQVKISDSELYVVFTREKKEKIVFLKNTVEIILEAELSETENLYRFIYGSRKNVIFFVLQKPDMKNLLDALEYLVNNAKHRFEKDPTSTIIERRWISADSNRSNALDLQEFLKLCNRLNISKPKKELEKEFKALDKDKNSNIDAHEFQQVTKFYMKRPELLPLFEKHCNEKSKRTGAEELLNFLQVEQMEEKVTITDCLNMIVEEGQSENATIGMDEHMFTRFLFSPVNSAIDSGIYKQYQDMSHPLCDYWIASSHNTYLMGNQLKGNSAVEMYRYVLKSGCKCVELDCWDGKDGEPIIFHGHTLTTKILFKDVIECIDKFAFSKSPYPVILSLEVHTSLEQQERMAKIMIDVFKEKLVLPEEMTGEQLPSPQKLMGRILLKGRRHDFESNEDDDDEEEEAPKNKTKIKVAKGLSDITALEAVKGEGKSEKVCQMISLSENALKKKDSEALNKFTKSRIIRVYPKGIRISSSNYNPIRPWFEGCQVVALNYQTNDDDFRLNELFFEENGKCGYLLKPAMLRDPNSFQGPYSNVPRTVHSLSVRVISAEHLPKPLASGEELEDGSAISPLVVVTLYDSRNTEKSTSVLSNYGTHPVWNETFSFEVECPEIAILKISVFHKNSMLDRLTSQSATSIIAENIIPIRALRFGYRNVPLRDSFGNRIDMCGLMCHFAMSVSE